jgi:hypothetical protein
MLRIPGKITKLLAPTVPLELKIDNPDIPPLLLKLAWSMKAAVVIEGKLRSMGVKANVISNVNSYWFDMDATRLAAGVWATAQQEQPQYADDEGFDLILSYMTPDNYTVAFEALNNAFMEALSPERRDAIKKAIADAEERERAKAEGLPIRQPSLAPQDPPQAQKTESQSSTSGQSAATTSA